VRLAVDPEVLLEAVVAGEGHALRDDVLAPVDLRVQVAKRLGDGLDLLPVPPRLGVERLCVRDLAQVGDGFTLYTDLSQDDIKALAGVAAGTAGGYAVNRASAAGSPVAGAGAAGSGAAGSGAAGSAAAGGRGAFTALEAPVAFTGADQAGITNGSAVFACPPGVTPGGFLGRGTVFLTRRRGGS